MQRLAVFIRESQTWSQAHRGTDLLRRVADALSQHLDIDAGMFVYRRRFVPNHFGQLDTRVRVYHAWGLCASLEHLDSLLPQSPWYLGSSSFFCSQAWAPLSTLPSPWQHLFEQSDISYVGAWPLLDAYSRTICAMVLGSRSSRPADDEELLSLCASQISLVAELLVERRKAEDVSRRDPLTGIFNRRGLLHFLPTVQQDAARRGATLVVGVLDVNAFKQINDQYGHARGDDVLLDVAQTLSSAIGESGIAARFGGDEFVFVWCVQGKTAEEVRQETIRQFMDKSYDVCVGCAVWNPDMEWQMCLDLADFRLYVGKGIQAGAQDGE
ncbi:hypothetical protein AAC03nite_18570 [Alicyclobacillus acidoterrestris]|nr:hypothetical protein AAC03nite_18570 [Alicyclobacillus acidoterrestris]